MTSPWWDLVEASNRELVLGRRKGLLHRGYRGTTDARKKVAESYRKVEQRDWGIPWGFIIQIIYKEQPPAEERCPGKIHI